MKVKNILYLFLLTNVAVPYIFTMEEGHREQVTEGLEANPDIQRSLAELYADLPEESRKPIREMWFNAHKDILGALDVLSLLESSKGQKLPLELRYLIIEAIRSDKNGMDILNAIRPGNVVNIDKVNKLLKKPYINFDVKDEYGETPLMIAVKRATITRRYPDLYSKWVEIAKMLLQKGASPNSQGENGRTALHMAISSPVNDPEIVQILLQNGANPNLQDKNGMTVLHLAARNNYAEMVQILLQNGANPNLQDKQGFTALGWAAYNHNAEMVQMLLQANADPNLQSIYGGTALDLANKFRSPEIIDILVKYGAVPELVSEQ